MESNQDVNSICTGCGAVIFLDWNNPEAHDFVDHLCSFGKFVPMKNMPLPFKTVLQALEEKRWACEKLYK